MTPNGQYRGVLEVEGNVVDAYDCKPGSVLNRTEETNECLLAGARGGGRARGRSIVAPRALPRAI